MLIVNKQKKTLQYNILKLICDRVAIFQKVKVKRFIYYLYYNNNITSYKILKQFMYE